jgi:Fe2+ transport system protein FeoA
VTLGEGKDGQLLTVTGTEGDDITWQALRFGIGEGSQIQVQKNIPGGPVIISKNQLEIAIGRQLASLIQVTPRAIEN